jgi:hypothetical protein
MHGTVHCKSSISAGGGVMSSSEVQEASEELSALFWDEIPEDADNPDAVAIRSILEASTPEEKAEGFKALKSYEIASYYVCTYRMCLPF